MLCDGMTPASGLRDELEALGFPSAQVSDAVPSVPLQRRYQIQQTTRAVNNTHIGSHRLRYRPLFEILEKLVMGLEQATQSVEADRCGKRACSLKDKAAVLASKPFVLSKSRLNSRDVVTM